MDPHYHDLQRQAVDLQYRLHDMLDQPDHSTANVLKHEAKQLVEDVEQMRHPRDIEQRIKTIQRELQQAQHQNLGIMSVPNSTTLFHTYEQMRNGVRRLPHY